MVTKLYGLDFDMSEAFDKKIRAVRFRCGVNVLLELIGIALIFAGGVSLLAVLIEKLFGVEVITWMSAGILLGCCLIIVLAWWFRRFPSRMQAALLMDERIKLKERFSTALCMNDSEDPFAVAARSQAMQMAPGVRIRNHFPIKTSKRWGYAAGMWVFAVAVFLFLPPQDLFGFMEKEREEDLRQQRAQQAKKEIENAAVPVKLAVKKLGDEELDAELLKFDVPQGKLPEKAKRQAIRKLGDLSEKVKKLQGQTKMQSVEMVRQMLKQLRGTPKGLSQKLSMELAKGNFSKAADLLRQYQKQISEGKLSEEDMKKLKQQLSNLSKQLKDLANKNAEFEKELEKAGLDKKLAKLSEKELRKALKMQGLNNEQIEKLMQKMAACKSAQNRCGSLGSAMASAASGLGGMNGEELSQVLEQLYAMDQIDRQMQMSQAAIDAIKQSLQALGQKDCKGVNCNKPGCGTCNSNKWGQGNGRGRGIGHGTASGSKPTAQDAETSTKKTKVKSPNSKQAPIVASWYFKGEQVKGEAQRGFSEVIQAGRDSAAEAISENEIPKKYQESVKKYFGGLEEPK